MRTIITYLYKVRRYCLLSSFNCCDVQRYNKSPNRSKFVCFSEVNPLKYIPTLFLGRISKQPRNQDCLALLKIQTNNFTAGLFQACLHLTRSIPLITEATPLLSFPLRCEPGKSKNNSHRPMEKQCLM